MSIGEDRVRSKVIQIDPHQSEMVKQFKQMTAELINACHNAGVESSEEEFRCWELAMLHYEMACMFATKAATTDAQ